MCRCSFSLFCPQIVIFTIYGLTIDVFFAHRLHRLTQIFVVFVISGVFGIKTKCRCSFSLLFYCMRVVGMTSERSKLQRSAQRDACVACRSKKSRSTDLGTSGLIQGTDFEDVARNYSHLRADTGVCPYAWTWLPSFRVGSCGFQGSPSFDFFDFFNFLDFPKINQYEKALVPSPQSCGMFPPDNRLLP